MKFSAIYGWLLVEVQYKRDRESRNETPRERLPGYSGRYFRADPFRSLLVGLASKGSPVLKLKTGKSQAKTSKDDDDDDEEEMMAEEWDSDDANDDDEDVVIPDQQTSSSTSSTPTFLQHLVHQQATFLQVKQELQEDLQEATHQAHQASINATDDSHLCVVCMDEERGVLYVPCNHLAVCVGCEEGLAAASMACPMCQEPIDRSRSITGIVVS